MAGSAERRKKVLLFANSAWYLQNFRENLMRELVKRGHDVVAVSPYDDSVKRLLGLGVSHLALSLSPRSVNPLRELTSIFKLACLLRRIKPDAVLSFTVKCNLYAGLLQPWYGFHHVVNISGLGDVFSKRGPVRGVVHLLYRRSLCHAGRVFFQNRDDMAFCVKESLVDEAKSFRIPGSGVDLHRFLPSTIAETGEKKRVFLMLGRLVPGKGYEQFVAAARRLSEGYSDRAEFWVMGIVDRKRQESVDIFELIRSAELKGYLRYLGARTDVLPVLQRADVVVLPSRYNEGVPRVLLEALACAKPIVTTDWKGCRDTVEAGRNGRLVPVGNEDALVTALEEMILLPQEGIDEMGRRSRKLAEEKFDERVVIGCYLEELRLAG